MGSRRCGGRVGPFPGGGAGGVPVGDRSPFPVPRPYVGTGERGNGWVSGVPGERWGTVGERGERSWGGPLSVGRGDGVEVGLAVSLDGDVAGGDEFVDGDGEVVALAG